MEDKLYLFKKQPTPLWNETKANSIIKNIISPFYVQELQPQMKTIDLPSNISKIYVTLIGGGGSGSLGEHRILHNTLEESDQSYTDFGYKNIIPLAGSGGGGGATIFRMPVIFRQKNRKTKVSFEVGIGGEGRETPFGNRVDPSGVSHNYPETQIMKDFRKGRNGGDTKIILRQFDSFDSTIKEIKIKAMGGAGGGVVGYFISRSQIMNMNSSDFNYIWDWSAAIESSEGNIDYVPIPGYTDPPFLYWDVRKSYDVSDSDYNVLSHISIAAENYLQLFRIPSYVIVAFHRELYYPIQDPGFRNDYISYNLLTQSESGITKFSYYKPNDVIKIGNENGYFSQSNLNESDFGDFTYQFEYEVNSNTPLKNFSFLYQYNPCRIGVDDRSSVGITRSKSDQLFGHPRYYLRTGFKYHYKDRTINLFRTDLEMPYNYPLLEKMALTSPGISSLTLNKWSTKFKLLMSKELPGPLYEEEMIKGEQGSFGGAGGSFLLYDDLTPNTFHGLYGGKGIKSKWNQFASGSGGRPYPRNIFDIVDMNEFNRLKGYENAYFYYGGKGYSSSIANSSGTDTLITNHLIAGSGGGTIDYFNPNHYISSRKYSGPPVTFKDVDPLATEGTNLKTYDGISQWYKNNYEKLGTGGKVIYQGWDPSSNPISKLYMNDKYGKHNLSFLDNGNPVAIEELLYIFGGGGGGGKAFYFEPGSGQESLLIEPRPAGIGCGSGGSCSMNEDGKSAIRGIPPMNVNWYLYKMLNSPSECKIYTEFADTIFVYTVTTLVTVMALNIVVSIIIDVFGGWVSSAVLGSLKWLAKGAGMAIKSAFKATKLGRSIINGVVKVGTGVSSLLGKGTKFSKFLSKINKAFTSISNFGSRIYNSNKRLFDVLGDIFSVLTNDWSFLTPKKPTKLFSLISEAEKLKDLIKNVEKLQDASEKLTKLEKLNSRLAEITNILGNKINYAQLNPRKYKALNWVFGTAVDDFFEKAGTKLDNYFSNYTKSVSKLTERGQKEVLAKISKLPDATNEFDNFKLAVYKDMKKLDRPAEQFKYVEELESTYKTILADKSYESFWKEIDVMKQTSEFFTKSENMIGDAKNYFLRMNNNNLPKLSSKQQREIIFDMSQRPLSTSDPVNDIKSIVDEIKKGPFTINEQGEILHNIFLYNQVSFFTKGQELAVFKKIQDQFGKKFYFNYYFQNINKQFYLYLRESENVGQTIPKFRIIEKLAKDPEAILSLDESFRFDLFKVFDSPDNVNHVEYCSKLINQIHQDPRVVKHLLKNPKILSEQQFGTLFQNIHASFLAKASADPENMELIIKNLDQFNLKPQEKITFQAYTDNDELVNFAIEDENVFRYTNNDPNILSEYNGSINYLQDEKNVLVVSNGVIQNKNVDLYHIRFRSIQGSIGNPTLPDLNIRIQKGQREYIETLRKNIQTYMEQNSSSFYRIPTTLVDEKYSSLSFKGSKITNEQLNILDDLFFKYNQSDGDATRLAKAKKFVAGEEKTIESKIAYYKLLEDATNNPSELNTLASNLDVERLPELNPPQAIDNNFETNLLPKIGTDYVPNRMNKQEIFNYYSNNQKNLSYSEARKLNEAFKIESNDPINFIQFAETDPKKIEFLKKLDLRTLTKENFNDRMIANLFILNNEEIGENVDIILKNFIDFYESQKYAKEKDRIKEIFEQLFPDSKFKNLDESEIKNLIVKNRNEMKYGPSITYQKTIPYVSKISDENMFSLTMKIDVPKNEKIDSITKLMAERNRRIQKKFSCS